MDTYRRKKARKQPGSFIFLRNEKGETTQVVGYIYFSESKHFEVANDEFALSPKAGIPEFLVKEYVKAWKPLFEDYEEK